MFGVDGWIYTLWALIVLVQIAIADRPITPLVPLHPDRHYLLSVVAFAVAPPVAPAVAPAVVSAVAPVVAPVCHECQPR